MPRRRASLFPPPSTPLSLSLSPHHYLFSLLFVLSIRDNGENQVSYRIIFLVSEQTTDNMSTRSGAEFRVGASAPLHPEEMPDWAKSILRNQEESKAQIEFLMAQLVELKTVKWTDTLPLASTAHNDTPPPHAHDDQKIETLRDAAKQGAKLEVTTFDGSLDPKKYMDWEAGLDEYFDWYQLPEGCHLQFAQMKLTCQARIY